MKYISIDIETLGLPKEGICPDVVEVGAVYDDLRDLSKIRSIETLYNSAFHVYLLPDGIGGYKNVDAAAAFMNQDVLSEIAEAKADSNGTLWAPDGTKVIHPNLLLREFAIWLYCNQLCAYMEETHYQQSTPPHPSVIGYNGERFILEEKINFAGKNAGTFDLPILDEQCFFQFIPRRHRVIDVGSMYLRATDDVVPNLAECCERASLDVMSFKPHRAVDDACVVVQLIRKKLGVTPKESKAKAITYSSATA